MSISERFESSAVFCIASGPSLTRDDCILVQSSGAPIIAVNNAFELIDRPDIIFANDERWWKHNKDSIEHDSNIEMWCGSLWGSSVHRIKYWPFYSPVNSGVRAVELAIGLGASHVYMLGYDCSVKNGTHFHGNHANTANPTEENCRQWQIMFRDIYLRNKNKITNCSRDTEIQTIPRAGLERVIEKIGGRCADFR